MLTSLLGRNTFASLALVGLLLSACGGSTDSGVPLASTPASTAPASATAPAATDGAGATGDFSHPVLAIPALAPDGSTFTIGDHAGKTIFVETFATWCSNCKRQLGDTNIAAAQAPDDAVFLVLSIEVGLDPAKLAAYAADNGFDNVTFGVLDDVGLAVLNDEFGRSVLNAPSTPKFLVSTDGSLTELTTGFESPEEILAQLA